LDIARHYVKQELWGPASTTQRRFFGDKHWAEPLKWNRQALKDGHHRSVFCASMADVYEDNPLLEPERERLWTLIEATPMLNWLLLTKRPENILKMSPWGNVWPHNAWVGTSVGLQKRAEERIPYLLDIPAVVRFVSCEPLLGPVNLSRWISDLDWVIAGGESGHGARFLDPTWVRSLRDQCQDAHIHFYFKQWNGRTHTAGGRLLDGRTWDEMPLEVPVGKGERLTTV
jgi:protein gp37